MASKKTSHSFFPATNNVKDSYGPITIHKDKSLPDTSQNINTAFTLAIVNGVDSPELSGHHALDRPMIQSHLKVKCYKFPPSLVLTETTS